MTHSNPSGGAGGGLVDRYIGPIAFLVGLFGAFYFAPAFYQGTINDILAFARQNYGPDLLQLVRISWMIASGLLVFSAFKLLTVTLWKFLLFRVMGR